MKASQRLALALLFALTGVLAVGLDKSEAATSKDEIVLVEGPEIESLDPPHGGSGFVRHFLELIYNGIVSYDENSQVVPGLAKSWKMDSGGKSWTFKFRKGVRFSNGNRFTAHAAKFTIDRILDKKTKARRRSVFIKVITKLEVIDDLTLRIHTKKPFPDLPNLVAILEASVIDPAAVKKWGKAFGQHPTGTGPFMLKEWVPGDKAVLVSNPHYWGPKPKVKRIIQKSIPEGSARVFSLERGEADVVAKIPTEEIPRLSKNPNIVLHKSAVQLNISYEINNVKKPWSDIRVRRALNYAVDKDAIVKKILGGFGVPSTGVAGPGIPGRRAFKPWPYDPAKARKLLAEAGYPKGFKMEVQ
ncbi:MAG: ABC transporter substrate-binding protein, partial [Nitrospinota bacterium]|nr:ABC transporter substrate-binding protein [Nitrospinota bacterium]